jgi:hypothetical protein
MPVKSRKNGKSGKDGKRGCHCGQLANLSRSSKNRQLTTGPGAAALPSNPGFSDISDRC